MIDLKSILGQNAFFQTNKKIASVVGHDAAALMTYLIEKDGYFSNDQVYKNGKNYFFLLSDDIEKDVYISYKVQKRCISDLEKLGFIETKLMGIPRRLYFTINSSVLLNFMTTINDQKDKAINDQKDKAINDQKDKAINDQKASMYNTKSEISYKELNIEKLNKELNIENLNKEYIDTSKIEKLPLEAKKENEEIKNKEISIKVEKSELENTFDDFLQMRKSIRKPATEKAIQLIKDKIKKLAQGSEKMAIDILNQSIVNSWQDVFPLKAESGKFATQQDKVKSDMNNAFKESFDKIWNE